MIGSHQYISADEIEEMLKQLAEILGEYRIIKNPHVLYNASQRVRETSRIENADWIIALDHDSPLIFNKSTCKRANGISPDIYCLIAGKECKQNPVLNMNVVTRFWSDDENLYYRQDWDASCVKRRVQKSRRGARVMLRCHFDLGEESTAGEPAYHMQVGGVIHEPLQENCWFSSRIRVPRFPNIPTDLILGVEMILSSFFPHIFLEMQERIEWKRLVFKSEYYFLRNYLKECANTAQIPIDRRLEISDDTILSRNWLIDS